MTKRIALLLCLAAMLAVLTLSAAAQETAIIKGICKDEGGKPIAGASIEVANADKGTKVTVKTGSGGEYTASGLTAGSYKVTLFASDGTPMFFFNNVPAKAASETVADFDLAKLNAEAGKQAGGNEDQRKENDKIKKENDKIKGLNAMLKQAAQQKKDGQYDACVTTMEQAAAQDQTHDIIYGALADCYNMAKKFSEAEGAFSKALTLAAPGSKSLANYHAGLALAMLQGGKIDACAAECEKTAQLDPSLGGQCYYNEGAVLTNMGKADDANQAFDKAIAIDPKRADSYYQKGVNLLAKATLSKDNKMIPAPGTAEALSKYLELAPDGKYAQAAKDLLTSLGTSVEASYGTQKKGKKN